MIITSIFRENIVLWTVTLYYPFKRQFHMFKQTKTIRRQIADELFECVWPFCEIGA